MRDPQPRYVGITTVTAIEITTVAGLAPIPPARSAHIHKSQITHVNTLPLLFFFLLFSLVAFYFDTQVW